MTNYSKMALDFYTNPSKSIQQQADEAQLPLNDYFDLYPEAGWGFEEISFNETRDKYAEIAAIDEASGEDAESLSDKFVAAFATFIINRAVKENKKFLTALSKNFPNVSAFDYVVRLLDGCEHCQINLHVKNGDCFYFKCVHSDLADGFEISPNSEASYINNLSDIYELSIDKKPHALGKDLLKFFAEILSATQE